MLQLGRIQSMSKQDLSFARFVDDLASIIECRGLKWIGIHGITKIAHSIGKMQVKSKSAQQIIEFAAQKENAQAMVLRGVPQECGKHMLGHGQARLLQYLSIAQEKSQESFPVAC